MRPLSDVARRIRPAVFAELQARIDGLAKKGIDLVPLQIGDTCLPPPESARRVLAGYDGNDAELHRYGATSGMPELRAAMARSLVARGLEVDPASEILVGNGGTHALFCAARVVLDEGDEVLMASPFWPLAPGVFTSAGAQPVEVPLTQRLYEDPSLDPAALLEAARTDRTKAIYVISPNNPDGKVLSASALARIAAFAVQHDLWVFSDEVYADMVYGSGPAPPSIASLPAMRERTILLRSLSKSHALAGIRIGYFAAPEPLVTAARRVSTHTAFNVSVAMQRAALAALEDETFSATARQTYLAARNATVRALVNLPVRFHIPEGATYVFVDFAPAIAAAGHGSDDGKPPVYGILERAVDRGVLLAPGDAFGRDYGSFARLCFTAVPPARLEVGLARLADAVLSQRTT
jgi:aspartate/methionine/tyrosine aminotransferase